VVDDTAENEGIRRMVWNQEDGVEYYFADLFVITK